MKTMSHVFFLFPFCLFVSFFLLCVSVEGDSQVQEIVVEFDERVKINND